MQPSRILFCTVAALALTACSQEPSMSLSSYMPKQQSTIVSEHLADQFDADDLALESNGKAVPVVAGGSDLGTNPHLLTQTVAQNLQGANWGAPLNFVPASGQALERNNMANDSRISPYSIIVMVNGPSDVTAAQLCADPALADTASAASMPMTSSATDVKMTSALCRYNTEVSAATGTAANVNGPQDPAFRNLLMTAANEMTRPSSNQSNTKFND